MTWINKGKFCVNSFLSALKIPHVISTKKFGNLKNPEIFREFIELLKKEDLFQNCNLDTDNIFLGEQKHTANYFEIKNHQTSSLIKNNDGFYSAVSGVGMGVYTADCMPIFLVVPSKRISALLHSGWKGVELDITGKCISEIMQKYGCENDEIFIVIGPHLKSCCYEVGKEFKQNFELEERQVKGEKKYFLDMQKNFVKKMINFGIPENNIKLSNFCTGCSKDLLVGQNFTGSCETETKKIASSDSLFFSYRLDGAKENRMMSVLWNKIEN